MNTPRAYSIVPIAPSHNTGTPVNSLATPADSALVLNTASSILLSSLIPHPKPRPQLAPNHSAAAASNISTNRVWRSVCYTQMYSNRRINTPQRSGLELFTLKNRSLASQFFSAQTLCGVIIALVTLGLASCGQRYYKFPAYTYANRPIPPSKIDSRVLVGI